MLLPVRKENNEISRYFLNLRLPYPGVHFAFTGTAKGAMGAGTVWSQYSNMAVNYSASELDNAAGNRVPGVTGTYGFWADENIFVYVPKFKILGAKFVPFAILNFANGSIVADLSVTPGANLSSAAGGSGFADTFVQPFGLGWNFKRADVTVGYGFVAPTGRYTA